MAFETPARRWVAERSSTLKRGVFERVWPWTERMQGAVACAGCATVVP